MFDTEVLPSTGKTQAETHSWRAEVVAVASSVGDAFLKSTWQEKVGVAAAVGVAAVAVVRGVNVREVAKASEVVEGLAGFGGHNSAFDRTVLSMAKSVDHFVFDLDSTLTDYYKASGVLRKSLAQELETATGLPAIEIHQSLADTSKKLGSDYFYNDLNRIDGIRKYYPDTDLNRKFAGVSEAAGAAYHDSLRARPDTVELFNFLKSKGKSIHVYTASPTTRALDKLTASGLEPYVDKIFTAGPQAFDDLPTSHLLTAKSPMHKVIPLSWDSKENGSGYAAIVEELGVPGRKISMTGDNLRQDIRPAQWFGMFTSQAQWFLRESSPAIKANVELETPKAFQTLLEEAYRR